MTSYFAQVPAHKYIHIVTGSDKDARRGYTRLNVCVCNIYTYIFVRGATSVQCRVTAFGRGLSRAYVIYIRLADSSVFDRGGDCRSLPPH